MNDVVTLSAPVALSGTLEKAHITVYGDAYWWDDTTSLASIAAKTVGSSKPNLYIALPPIAKNNFGGRFAVGQPDQPGTFSCEGLLLKKRKSVGISWGRDCYLVVLEHIDTGDVAFAHVGRDSLIEHPACTHGDTGIIGNLVNAIVPRGGDRSRIVGFVGGGICAKHFTHPDERIIEPFKVRFPKTVGFGGQLDLIYVITAQLTASGIIKKHLRIWDTCSYENKQLGSSRAERNGIARKSNQNVFMVYRP